MGLYNTIEIAAHCPQCVKPGPVEVQFKFGNLHDHEYGLGSALVWGRPEVGGPELRAAVIGIGECASCGAELRFDIIVDKGTVEAVQLSRGQFSYRDQLFVVIQDASMG